MLHRITVELSNFTGWQLQKAVDIAEFRGLSVPVSMQPQYNLLARAVEWEIAPACQAAGLGMLAWSPLASGWLTGKYRRGEPAPAGTRVIENADEGMRIWNQRGQSEQTWQVLDVVRKVAEGRGVSLAQVAIAWLMARPRRMVLPAFYRLAREGLLPRQWQLVGNGRGDITHQDFRARVHDALAEFGPKPGGQDWDSFAQRVFFASGGFSSDSPGSLPDVLAEARTSLGGSPQLVHYLAVPPVALGGLTQALGQYGLARGARVVYEKPFGTSPGSFRELCHTPVSAQIRRLRVRTRPPPRAGWPAQVTQSCEARSPCRA